MLKESHTTKTNNYLYILSKQDIKLSLFELSKLVKQTKTDDNNKNNSLKFSQIDNIVFFKENIDVNKTAYTKKGYRVLLECKPSELKKKLLDLDIECNDTYKYEGKLEIADIIWNKLNKNNSAKVDLKNPKNIFETIKISDELVCFCILESENKTDFESRKAHMRPHNHPTSLHPKLARAMINLSKSEEILDPFCGTGGLLLEAGILGKKITGYDLSNEMIIKAKDNLQAYGIYDFELLHKDALTLNQFFQAIVTDVPYGRNSKVNALDLTINKFIELAYEHSKTLVIALPDFVEPKLGKWIIEEEFDYYLHKNLTKKIYVLRKNS